MEECVICYDALGERNICVLSCGHRFHATCAMKSARLRDSCALCREPIGANINNENWVRIMRMPMRFDMQTFEIIRSLHELEREGKITNERWHQVKNLLTGESDLTF